MNSSRKRHDSDFWKDRGEKSLGHKTWNNWATFSAIFSKWTLPVSVIVILFWTWLLTIDTLHNNILRSISGFQTPPL